MTWWDACACCDEGSGVHKREGEEIVRPEAERGVARESAEGRAPSAGALAHGCMSVDREGGAGSREA